MARILNQANKDTSPTSDPLTGDVTLNVGGIFSGDAVLNIRLNPAAGEGYVRQISEPDYLSITAKSGTTLVLDIDGGNDSTAIDADLL